MGGFNGNGVYTRYFNWTQDAAAGIKIRADRMDQEDSGFATGLSTCITKDGQTTVTANLPLSNFRFLNVSDAQNKNEFYTLNQAMNGFGMFPGLVSGTGDAIVLSYSPAYSALTQYMRGSFIATAPNTTAATLTIDALTTKPFTKNGSTALVSNDITAGMLVQWQYDGTQYQLLNPNSATGVSNKVSKTGDTMTGTLAFTGAAINEAKGTDIPSAISTPIGAATGNYVNVTGTTTITSFDTVQAGAMRIVTFTGILTLTYNSTSLILPGSANIITAAGDSAIFESLGSGNWKCISYTKQSGQAVSFIDRGPRKIQSTTISSGTSSVVINNFNSGSDYRIICTGLSASTTANPILTTSTDNGSTFATSYVINSISSSTSTVSALSAGVSAMQIGNPLTNSSLTPTNIDIYIRNPNDATYYTDFKGISQTVSGSGGTGTFTGTRVVLEANNAIKIALSTGTFSGGLIEVWEIKP